MPSIKQRAAAVTVRALRRGGWELRRVQRAPGSDPTPAPDPVGRLQRLSASYGTIDYPDEWNATLEQVRPFTLCSAERMGGLIAAVEHVVRNGIEGAFVECGVWRGGSSMAAALTFARLGEVRDVYLFDTFEGMSPPSDEDVDLFGNTQERYHDTEASKALTEEVRATVDDVRANMLGTGYPSDRVHLCKGMVEATVPASAPERIAILRLDTDWYESTRHELEHLYPRLADGGVLIVDDYGHYEGARKAVDEYLGDRVFLHRLDYTGRLVVKRELS